MRARETLLGLIGLALLTALLPAAASLWAAPSPESLVQALQTQTGGQARIAYHAETGLARFVGAEGERPLRPGQRVDSGAGPEEVARAFLSEYGPLFGLRDQAAELTVMRERTLASGRSFVRFRQQHRGVPVLAGEIVVQTDADRAVISAGGELLPDLPADTRPTVPAAAARDLAAAAAAKAHGLSTGDLHATQPELWLYHPALLGAPGAGTTRVVWRVEVGARDLLPIEELVLVDAQRGGVVLQFNQVAGAKNRLVYDNGNSTGYGLPGNGPVRVEGGAPSAVADVNHAYDYAGHAYDFYYGVHGRDSIDGLGMNLVSTVRYCVTGAGCPYANAFWSNYHLQMVYGQGFASADDVVAHEITHGVTRYESNLLYYMQSGAINEALSDIWGEFVDLTNGAGNDGPSVRWLVGEDLPIGAIRDMKDPTAPPNPCTYPDCTSGQRFRQPDRMSSPYYYCGTANYGGVHINSGVGNKAAYLMVDGGAFNGRTVNPLGLEKTAKVWYGAQTNLLTSGSDWADLYIALQQSCAGLVGSDGITAADCQAVKNALDAVEMHAAPTKCAAAEAPVCPAGQNPRTLFFDDMENTGSGNWAFAGSPAGAAPNWGYATGYAKSGTRSLYRENQDRVSDTYAYLNSGIALPSGSVPYLRFSHAFEFEHDQTVRYDGGVVEYSVNGGAWTDAGSLFVDNGYTGTIDNRYGNPLGGRAGFVGLSYGYGSSRADLSSLAGQSVRFRYRVGTDGAVGTLGWLVDDVHVYTCTAAASTPTPTGAAVPAPTPYLVYLPLVSREVSDWITILEERFEGAFPGPWQVTDNSGSDGGEYTWGRRDCVVYAGSGSGWGVGGGATGGSMGCGANYPNNALSWMVYGPFSLADAQAAELSFKLWLYAEYERDALFYGASVDGNRFSGLAVYGNSNGWVDRTLNLAEVGSLGNLTGLPQVWIALVFLSDSSGSYPHGAHVDNIVLRKSASPQPGVAGNDASSDERGLLVRTETLSVER